MCGQHDRYSKPTCLSFICQLLLISITAQGFAQAPGACILPEIPNGETLTGDYGDYDGQTDDTVENGKSVTVDCHIGYRLSAGNEVIHCKNGKWEPATASCEKVMCKLPNVFYGRVFHRGRATLDDIPAGDFVHVVCNPGYQEDKPSYLTCKSKGQWDRPAPNCLSEATALCTVPKLLNARIKKEEEVITNAEARFLPGVVLDIGCYRGYQREGPRYLRCRDGGKWNTAPPTCKVSQITATCLVPPIPNSVIRRKEEIITGPTARFLPGEEIKIGCKGGFRRIGEKYLKCHEDGKWNNKPPECARLIYHYGYCYLPELTTGRYLNITKEEREMIEDNTLLIKNENFTETLGGLQGNTIKEGELILIHCQTNASLVGNPIFECTSEGNMNETSFPRCELPKTVSDHALQKFPKAALYGGIAGAVVVVILFIVIVTVAVIRCRRYRRRRKRSAKEKGQGDEKEMKELTSNTEGQEVV